MLGFSKEDIGKNEVNSSAVGMLQNNQIDVYTIPNDMTLVPCDNPFIEATKVAIVNPLAFLVFSIRYFPDFVEVTSIITETFGSSLFCN